MHYLIPWALGGCTYTIRARTPVRDHDWSYRKPIMWRNSRKLQISVYVPMDVIDEIDEAIAPVSSSYRSRSDFVRECIERYFREVKQEIEDSYPANTSVDTTALSPVDRAKRRAIDSIVPPGQLYDHDAPWSERPFSGDRRIPPLDDDSIPNPEHFRNHDEMMEYMSDIDPTWVPPGHYASDEHIEVERRAAEEGPML